MRTKPLHVVPANAGTITTGGYVVAMLFTRVTHIFRYHRHHAGWSPRSRGRQWSAVAAMTNRLD
jgi:hypothetical protein